MVKRQLAPAATIILFLAAALAGGYWLEGAESLAPTRKQLQKLTLASPATRLGKRGSILEQMGLKYVVPRDYSEIFDAASCRFTRRDRIGVDSKRADYTEQWTDPGKVDPAELPSSIVLSPQIVARGMPLLSVVVDPHDLNDPGSGIFANAGRKGKRWERYGYISFFENGSLVFGSGAGVRVHGGGNRSGRLKSLRFYFRKAYGRPQLDRRKVFDVDGKPLERLIVRIEQRFNNALGFDIARRVGCRVPDSRPARVYLNGEAYGDGYILTEHLSLDYLEARYGHRRFVLARADERTKYQPEPFQELVAWALDRSRPMTLEAARKRVDLENLGLWWICQFYCAGAKYHLQGPAVLDRTHDDARWFWINWDMDDCFAKDRQPELALWQQDLTWRHLFRPETDGKRLPYHEDPRALIMRRLHAESADFRRYFEDLLMEVLNHRLDLDYALARLDYYERFQKQYGAAQWEYGDEMRQFFKKRPFVLMQLMGRYLGSPPAHPCRVDSPLQVPWRIDGYTHDGPYAGWYFKGTTIRIETPPSVAGKLLGWRVNGQEIPVNEGQLTHTVEGPTVIKPVFGKFKPNA